MAESAGPAVPGTGAPVGEPDAVWYTMICCGGRAKRRYATTAPNAAAIAMKAYTTGCIPPRRRDPPSPAIESGASL